MKLFIGTYEILKRNLKIKIPLPLNINKVKFISTGMTSYHKFIITQTDEIYAVGSNKNNQLGLIK